LTRRILVWYGHFGLVWSCHPEGMPLSSVKRSFAKPAAFLERSRRSLAGGVSSPFGSRSDPAPGSRRSREPLPRNRYRCTGVIPMQTRTYRWMVVVGLLVCIVPIRAFSQDAPANSLG
jgi:hypothetical protein